MNYYMPAARPFVALVDDDFHSARMLTIAAIELGAMLAGDPAGRPALVIVDVKASSSATREFITAIRALPRGSELLIAAVAPTLDREVRDTLLDAGADAVFQRHADIEAYRRETASIVSFWVRHQRLNAIGT